MREQRKSIDLARQGFAARPALKRHIRSLVSGIYDAPSYGLVASRGMPCHPSPTEAICGDTTPPSRCDLDRPPPLKAPDRLRHQLECLPRQLGHDGRRLLEATDPSWVTEKSTPNYDFRWSHLSPQRARDRSDQGVGRQDRRHPRGDALQRPFVAEIGCDDDGYDTVAAPVSHVLEALRVLESRFAEPPVVVWPRGTELRKNLPPPTTFVCCASTPHHATDYPEARLQCRL